MSTVADYVASQQPELMYLLFVSDSAKRVHSLHLQVPQYLFEDAVAAGFGGDVNIIVCQPRRIAAIGLATRVADEVGDPVGVGGLVGYSVRLDSKSSQQTRLLFCTTGVLLRRLMSDPQLTGGCTGR